MGYKLEEACNGCAECHSCNRKHQFYKVFYCDHCKDETEELYYSEKNSAELCFDCYKKETVSKICDDMDEDRCSECGAEAEELFNYYGKWLCVECLEEKADKVVIE